MVKTFTASQILLYKKKVQYTYPTRAPLNKNAKHTFWRKDNFSAFLFVNYKVV